MGAQYEASSLEDIASQFMSRADLADRLAAKEKTKLRKSAYLAEATTWREAAEMMRATKLVKP